MYIENIVKPAKVKEQVIKSISDYLKQLEEDLEGLEYEDESETVYAFDNQGNRIFYIDIYGNIYISIDTYGLFDKLVENRTDILNIVSVFKEWYNIAKNEYEEEIYE